MAWRCLHSIVKDASANDNYEKSYFEVYELDSIADFNSLLFAVKKKNTLVCEVDKDGKNPVFWIVDSASLSKRQPMPGGRVQVEITLHLRYLRSGNELLAPWEMPAFNFRLAGAINEESASKFYPDVGDLWYQDGCNDELKDFVNTAGVMLEGTATFSTAQMSFSYAITMDTFLLISDWFWSLSGKINSDTVTICGMQFPPRTLRLESLNAEYCETQKPGWATTGFEVRGNAVIYQSEVIDTLYKYYRIDATFTANPRTWNQSFLNVGTHVRRGNTVMRLWNWYSPLTHEPMWGTYGDYRMSGGENGEAVTEPVSLNIPGTGAMPCDETGRQIMTYRYGSLYEPIPFQDLGFPEALPIKWEF